MRAEAETNGQREPSAGRLFAIGASAGRVEALSKLAKSSRSHELWGLRSDEVFNEHLLNLDIGLPVERLREPIHKALERERTELVITATNRRGRSISCRVSSSPLSTPSGEVTGAILVTEVEQ